MRRILMSPALCCGIFFSACLTAVSAEPERGELLVKFVHGYGSYCTDKTNWKPLAPNLALTQGAILRTEANSSADVIFSSSGSAVRLAPSTLVEVARLE